MNSSTKRALVSVSDKSQLADFASGLTELGYEILSTGGTYRFLHEHNIPVVEVSAYTEFPEIMGGRVKTLHPKIHGAILGRPDQPDDAVAIKEQGIKPFDLVVCNLYPFEQTIAKPDCTFAEAVEQIDIGGPSMIRAAAKNHACVGLVTNSDQYQTVLQQLKRAGSLSDALRRELAAAAFEMTARYDRAIADYFALQTGTEVAPATHTITLQLRDQLRYGENPHQSAALYSDPKAAGPTLTSAEQLHGKELSYNNLLDLDAALTIARDFEQPAAVVIKHTNPCGCAVADTLSDAFVKAYSGDPVSAFGSIIGFNRVVDLATAEQLCQPNQFVEAVIAPGFDPNAFELITTKPSWKKNVRLLTCANWSDPIDDGSDYRRVTGGLLMQERDNQPEPISEWKVVTDREPDESERQTLAFAWTACKHVKSNAIVLAKDNALVGVGAGQMSRVDSSYIAAHKAGERSQGAVLASDAFFPFRDGVDQAAAAGVTAIIQPGGSKRDEEVIAACNEHNVAMLCTGRRHFKH